VPAVVVRGVEDGGGEVVVDDGYGEVGGRVRGVGEEPVRSGEY